MQKPVGFDQKIVLKHLDFTAREARYTQRKDMYAKLDEFLSEDIKGDKSRKNAITMLMKIWFLVDTEHEKLRNEALKLYGTISEDSRLALHWGMTILAYPFFKDIADEMGNLIRLQNEVPSQQIGRKIKMLYGDRRRVEVATSAVLMSMKSWGIVERGKNQIYTLKKKINLEDVDLKNWITEVVIRVNQYGAVPLDILSSMNVLFPFELYININEINTEHIKVNRQGVDQFVLSI